MKIGILGCGATGSVFASYLKMGGADDIWLIDLNKAHMDAVRDHGMTMTDHNGVHHLTGFHTAYNSISPSTRNWSFPSVASGFVAQPANSYPLRFGCAVISTSFSLHTAYSVLLAASLHRFFTSAPSQYMTAPPGVSDQPLNSW